MKQTIIIKGHIPVKKNRYRIARNGNVYKPTDVTDFEDNVREQVIVQRIRNIDHLGDIEVRAHFAIGGSERDVDGMLTTALDALQDAGVFENDKTVQKIIATKRYDKAIKKKDEVATITITSYTHPDTFHK